MGERVWISGNTSEHYNRHRDAARRDAEAEARRIKSNNADAQKLGSGWTCTTHSRRGSSEDKYVAWCTYGYWSASEIGAARGPMAARCERSNTGLTRC